MSPARRNFFVVACRISCVPRRFGDSPPSSPTKSATIGMTVRRISVKDTRSRWGSCAADRSIGFSWRLVMTPEFVQDYVVAHEVAHLRHLNHGKRFWALVDRLTPHAATAIPWLRAEGFRLLRVG